MKFFFLFFFLQKQGSGDFRGKVFISNEHLSGKLIDLKHNILCLHLIVKGNSHVLILPFPHLLIAQRAVSFSIFSSLQNQTLQNQNVNPAQAVTAQTSGKQLSLNLNSYPTQKS